MRPLGPKTIAQYDRILARAFDAGAIRPEVAEWPNSQKALLRAAYRRNLLDANTPSPDVDRALAALPGRSHAVRKAIRFLSEAEAAKYQEAASRELLGELALLPLMTGLRADEVISLVRRDVENATEEGLLRVVRKTGKEQYLPFPNAIPLFRELLTFPVASTARTHRPDRRWQHLGQILSPASPGTQYHALRRLVLQVGRRAGLRGVRPHLLRHAFATRFYRDSGNDIALLKEMLGHANVQTTMIYVHADLSKATKFLRNL